MQQLSKKHLRQRERRRQFMRMEAPEVLEAFSSAMNDAGLTFWLEFGTLLGFYREHDFIGHDYDIDFGAFLEDAPKIRRVLLDRGFKLVRTYRDNGGGLEECYRYLHTAFDIFYFRRDSNGLYCTSYSRGPRSWLTSLLNRRVYTVKRISIPDSGFVPAEFKGCKVNVPVDCPKHLTWHYGESFMTPNPDFDYRKEATNIYYYTPEECSAIGKFYRKK